MLEYSRWKYAVILIVVLISALYALPNVFPQDPSVQISAGRGAQVDDALKQRVSKALGEAGIKPKSIEKQGENLLVRTADADTQSKTSDTLRAALGSDYVVAMNLASNVPSWLKAIGAKPMPLGLDLQGGVHFLMEVDKKSAIDKRFEAYLAELRSALRDAGIGYESIDRSGERLMLITLNRAEDAEKAQSLAQTTLANRAADTGALAMANAFQYERVGNTVRIDVSEEMVRQMTINAIEQNLSTLRNRINALGVAEPIIQRQGADRVVVQLPGVQDTAEAKRILGATATLEYRGVYEGNALDARETGNVPPGARLYESRNLGPDGKPIPVLLNKRLIVGGENMVNAMSTVDSRTGQPAVLVTLNTVGGQHMLQYSTENVGKLMAVVYIERIPQVRMVDGKPQKYFQVKEEVISQATIQEPLGKTFQTTGLERKEAEDLSRLLRAGSLAAPMDFVEERTVGPSLGKQNVERGLKAVVYSFLFALAFFLVYYRMFGLVTCLALMLNLLMVFALMSVFDATLSLPGLAGIALTVGMSVDANVLINERIREELRAGLPPMKAISEGYDRASGTILDANITAFLAGLAMFAFGTGPLKGFGVTTMLGIATSAYTAVSVSRGIATLIYGRRRKLNSIAI
ncbi:MAG: protein translocase subunit SecD [Pseudomonadota bacterium]